MNPRETCTRILASRRDGFEELLPLVYEELRRLAGSFLRQERAAHTLQPTALAHEAYLRLVDETRVEWTSEGQFLAIAARAMRRILIEHARKRNAQKRGGDRARVTLTDGLVPGSGPTCDILDIDEAIEALTERDTRKGQVAELRIFGGLTLAQVAETLGVSATTAEDDWYMARAWLRERLKS